MLGAPKHEFISGARDTFPLLLGAFPFGLIYGALAVTSGLSPGAGMAMAALVFAGSAQFIAVGMVAAQAPVVIIILTTFIVNLRHMLYSATLLPHLKGLPQRWRIPLAFWLALGTDMGRHGIWTAFLVSSAVNTLGTGARVASGRWARRPQVAGKLAA